ncbi:homoserine dehydrogenase [Cytophagaceae bacterium DM2B3-1]|uniref:Homoserine dehydrogenase n=1 Tax=Xanthocytophaga flava TaxID=3048013 RepID=A0AAE3QGJ1_9BACT|nr:homoserine dehydrogenase [Xanthocytophaga flavus]MDJ1466291.1 homoserine dehydrogenase [Xanthocytophaga flavus]MDJ1478962.1 homoserine dehydrogenase [Xanthocytophaga flavus]MDJ1495496.1 homoserine dehydrogenase [Xanthocytophaga flavus]
MSKKLRIGLFGFGVVGQGLYDIFTHTTDFNAEIVKICVKNPHKSRPLPADRFTFDPDDILGDPTINLVVEMINNTEDAYIIAKTALQNGKTVVSASKKMIAENLEELVALQNQYNTPILYEAAVCGSIPIIRNLEEYYDNELLYSVSGIVNGTSNYILSKIFQENLSYETALRQAQEAGFAETDPTADVGGFDALNKLCLLVTHSYGIFVKPEELFNYGIQSLSKHDIQFAKEKGLKIKLVAQTRKLTDDTITAFVMPQFIAPNDYLYNVENEYNGVAVEAAFADKQFFMGKGAGGHPTGSAVLSDISACRYDYQYEYKKHQHTRIHYTNDVILEVYVRYYQEAVLDVIPFLQIHEKYSSHNFHYIIGDINLSDLILIKSDLATQDLFIANTGKKTTASKPLTAPIFVSDQKYI